MILLYFIRISLLAPEKFGEVGIRANKNQNLIFMGISVFVYRQRTRKGERERERQRQIQKEGHRPNTEIKTVTGRGQNETGVDTARETERETNGWTERDI